MHCVECEKKEQNRWSIGASLPHDCLLPSCLGPIIPCLPFLHFSTSPLLSLLHLLSSQKPFVILSPCSIAKFVQPFPMGLIFSFIFHFFMGAEVIRGVTVNITRTSEVRTIQIRDGIYMDHSSLAIGEVNLRFAEAALWETVKFIFLKKWTVKWVLDFTEKIGDCMYQLTSSANTLVCINIPQLICL